MHIKTLVFIAASFTTAKRQMQTKCLWMDEWMNNMWWIHTMEYDSALKRKEILTRYNMFKT